MSISMIGTVTLKEFQVRPLGSNGKGLQVEGIVSMQIPFSAQIHSMPFKVTEYAEKQAEFLRKYFFTEQGKQSLAKGSLSFDETAGWYFLIKELEFTSFKDAGATTNTNTVANNYKKQEQVQAKTEERPSLLNASFNAAKTQEEKLSNTTEVEAEAGTQNPGAFGNSSFWQGLKKKPVNE